jgi:hypothetical protein
VLQSMNVLSEERDDFIGAPNVVEPFLWPFGSRNDDAGRPQTRTAQA